MQAVKRIEIITDPIEFRSVVDIIGEERLRSLVESVRPVLRQFGGACLVSDAMWVIH